jgi:hypothetical protein
MNRVRVLMFVALLTVSFVSWDSYIPAAVQLQAISSQPLAFGWAKTWGGSSGDGVNHVAVDGSGNLYVAGEFVSAVDFDPQGGNPNATFTSYNGSIDAFLSKFDSSGKFLWARTWGGQGRDVAYGVGVDGSGNAYVVGPFRYTVDFNPDPTITETHTSNAGGENNIYLSKFAPDGTFQWVRTWGPTLITGSFGAEGYNVALDGNYLYVVGDFRATRLISIRGEAMIGIKIISPPLARSSLTPSSASLI